MPAFSSAQKHAVERLAINHPNRLEKIGVIVLDSNPLAGELYQNMLAKLGFKEIYLASDGVEGIQLIKKMPLMMMLADVELKLHLRQPDPILPDKIQETVVPMSGISVVQRLRQSPASPNPFIPIILMLDGGHEEQARAARDAGVNQVVYKPLRVPDLCGRIAEIVEQPRIFVTAATYKGPCRRYQTAPPPGIVEKRKYSVCLIPHNS